MSTALKHIVRFIVFILVQVYVLDKVHIHYMITPYIYFLFILWLPFNMKRSVLMIVAFLLGITLDSFRHNPGFHAAACVLIAYIRPFLINLLIPQEGADTNYQEPSAKSLGGFGPYATYIAILALVHNAWLFLLEAWQFANLWYFLVKTLLSTIISLLLILVTEIMFTRKQKFRTNTV
ncbi:rod shape-determining protein MreD [Ferruginibacter albus]|uniref:rod shape-determining protein MreD n=1 Tax=Ferruginibacter albus TaxID=2875540 RepID=UPI001CC7E093|nr:rod shape-determining protein MreD [Ferruginibacter albus]UAY52351.1 rod shape-determining protein MreD [Ferruginibacter albus]